MGPWCNGSTRDFDSLGSRSNRLGPAIYPHGVMETRVTLTHKLLVQVQLRVPFGGRWLGLPHRGGTKGNKTHSNAREMLSITAGAHMY